jgi:quercetin dioxygenase-like cupin family protein
MKILRREELPGRPLTEFGSVGDIRFISDSVVRIELPPGGRIGTHPAVDEQLFIVVAGEGDVRSGSDAVHVVAGDAVRWSPGEEHEMTTETGLVAIVVEPS